MNNPPAAASTAPRLAVLMLCHESPATVAARLASPFFQHPDVAVYLHYDGARSAAQRRELRERLPAGLRVRFVEPSVACRWGEHSLVQATRLMMDLALADQGFGATHLALLSTSCVPTRPPASLLAFLRERAGIEFIQAHDIRQGRWIRDGLESERHEYYFPFNYRSQKKRFEWLTERQREFRVRRRVPDDMAVHFGSQWFCLTRATAAEVAARLARPDIARWMRWSWIPDEFAIQTLVAHLCSRARIAGHGLTYYEFDHHGHPVVLENDHLDHLLAQPFFFARKLAPEATRLAQALDEHVRQPEADLGYFARVGTPTAHHARRLAEVATGAAARAHVGTVEDLSRGPMGSNRRRYYVLRASSRTWLLALCRVARGDGRLPLFDLPFDPDVTRLAGDGGHLGFQPTDRHRRDHDPAGYLLELVQADASQPAAFGLDLRHPGWARGMVRGDSRATLIDCDPPLSREQRAATALAELDRAADAPVILQVLEAMRDGGLLPDERFLAQGDGPPACQAAALRELGPELGDATLLALRNAYHALDPAPYHIAPGAAWRQFWK